jgi:hypothetical protein
MLRLKMRGEVRLAGARRTGAVLGILAAGFLMLGSAELRAQGTVAPATQQPQPIPIAGSKIALAAPVTYANTWEIYGALNFQNFMAGQNLPKRMNLGGGEVLGTYWLRGDHWYSRNIGLGADYRIDAGTTPVFANGGTTPLSMNGTGINNRPLVYLNTFMLGGQYRWLRNQYVSVNPHAYGGVSHGVFNYSLKNVFPQDYPEIGLYTNRTKPMAALGGSIDFNLSKKWAVRFSPDLILEHFGTETREFVAVSGGAVYRFGKK